MDIKNLVLSNYKSEKTKASLEKLPLSTDKLKNASHINKQLAKDITQVVLKEGQTLRGEVVDLRYDSVTIRLEPDNQVVVAKLDGYVELSIGQTAEFYVAEDGSNRIVLRYLPMDGTSTNIIIDKALSATNISLTNRNRSIVIELLANQMPIDKNTLLTLVRLSHVHHEASPLTLVLMYKYNIPITKENIQQLEAYQNGSNEIMAKINTLTDSLLELVGKSYETIIANSETCGEALTNSNQSKVYNIGSTNLNHHILNLNKQLLQLLNNNTQTHHEHVEFYPNASIHDVLSRENIALITNIIGQNSETPLTLNTLQDIIANPSFTLLPESIKNLINQYYQKDVSLSNSPKINTIFNQEERTELIRLLMAFSNTKQLDIQNDNLIDNSFGKYIFRQINSGEAPINDTFAYVSQNILKSDAHKKVNDIIQSPIYSKLLQAAIRERWTVSPEKLDKYSISKLYDSLDVDIKHINNMLELNKDSTEYIKLHEHSKDLQDNLSFIKDLNQIFNYLPLPIQFKNQDAHCDLYVLNKKKGFNDLSNNLTVLLHLDMEHLGSLNVHLSMKNKLVSGRFYIEDLSSVQLISTHMELLVDNLREKGYDFVPEVINNYEKPNFTTDFIKSELKDNDFSRYTFDVRT